MRVVGESLVLAPTDFSSFLSCRHRTGLDLAAARRTLARPSVSDPFAATLQRLGAAHEQRYVDWLRAQELKVAVIVSREGSRDDPREIEETLAAMRAGVDVIVQARLACDNLAGYADILMRVARSSDLGAWSYEVQDTKLARETKGGTILQLCAYSELLGRMQGCLPECFQVVTPGEPEGSSPHGSMPRDRVDLPQGAGAVAVHSYRVQDYAAYYRMVRAALESAVAQGHETLLASHYPEPVEPCAVCIWERRCHARRRADDHLSFVAGTTRTHRVELTAQGYPSLAAAATMAVPVTFGPSRGARETYNRIGHQARVQHLQRTDGRPIVERLPVMEGEGLCCLPEPSAADVFLDLEGSRFAREGGREFLFGVWHAGRYRAWWASSDAEERAAFEAVMDLIEGAWAAEPAMHVYHFNHYEPTAFKKLVGRHAARADVLDRLLRAGQFVDLYPITRQAVRAGVESYSIKKLEQYTGYQRGVALESASRPLQAVELALESGAPDLITAEIRDAVQGYNEDDCRSIEALRDWLEGVRGAWIAEGTTIPRPASDDGDAPPDVDRRQQEVAALRERLLAGLAGDAHDARRLDHPRWLLAYLIDWHRREQNADYWDFFRLLDLPEEELLDEKKAIAGLEHVAEVEVVRNKRTGRPTGSVVHRYHYPSQETDIGGKGELKLQSGEHFGSVVGHDRALRTLDVKTKATVHPSAVYLKEVIDSSGLQESVMRAARRALAESRECGLELIHRREPRLKRGAFVQAAGESEPDFAVRIVTELDRTTLSIQGPPGSGKTHTGAQMIRALVRAGRKVGVTATSHKVIRNLLGTVVKQAEEAGEVVRVGARVGDASEHSDGIDGFEDSPQALQALASGSVHVLGGTAWLWSPEAAAAAVDVLFVDEAGQMSLANVLAVAQASDSLVLLGDPRQLDQPQKASHPDGVGVSALEHVLGRAETMPRERGIFLPITHRMSPAICAFTAELFYEGKLTAKPSLAAQELRGTRGYDGSRLWLLPVEHDGNQNASDEEVEAVAALVDRLLTPDARWVDERGRESPLTPGEIRIVAPFNAQVNRLIDRLRMAGSVSGAQAAMARGDIPVGTVDRFQGQSAAVVIYSMTTSRAEDAPRGMEFLYSLNRFNVATSRARCAVFVVCSPRLLEPECRTPRQMQLANALCRYRELAMPRDATVPIPVVPTRLAADR